MYFFPPDIFIVLQISLVGCLITKPHNGYFQSHAQQNDAHFHQKMAQAILLKLLLQKPLTKVHSQQ